MALGEWKDKIIIQKSVAAMIRQETTFYRGWIITPATPM